MTAVNLITTPTVGYLSADAAIWNADGTVREIASKLIVAKEAKTAVAARGIFSQGHLHRALGRQKSLEALMVAAEQFAQTNTARVARDRAWTGWAADIEIYGVSWHEGGPVSWVVSEAYREPMRVTGLTYSPDVDLSAAVGAQIGSSAEFSALDPRLAFLGLMTAQRRLTIQTTAGGMHCVGGRCELAIVTQNGVTVETLATWPDRIGRMIAP